MNECGRIRPGDADTGTMDRLDESFLALVREHEGRLRRICRVYGSGRDAEEDLYQDILVQLWRSLPSFRGESGVGTWLYRVALNTALARRRRRRARPEVPLDAVHEPRSNAAPPDERLDARRRRERLYAAIERLDDVDRAIVTMYLDGRSYREIAEVLGISESNTGVKLHRIRKRLAAWLDEDSP